MSISFSNLDGQHQAEIGKIQSRLQALGGRELGEIGGIFPPELLAKRRVMLIFMLILHHGILNLLCTRNNSAGTRPGPTVCCRLSTVNSRLDGQRPAAQGHCQSQIINRQ